MAKKEKAFLVGVDEAGRGSLAGPVVACAVMLFGKEEFNGIDICDSKKLSAKKRENSYLALTKCPSVRWGVGVISEKIIDKINIREATKKAMKKAVLKLGHKNLYLIIDGDFEIGGLHKQEARRKADGSVLECMIASIIAKVERDRLMQKYDKKYPGYGFSKHKGYGTKLHYDMIKKFGPSFIHRKSYRLL